MLNQEGEKRNSADMQHYVLTVFSNYVHGRYPEIMDMFGGTPVHAYFAGMLHTRKDEENIAVLFALVDSVELCVKNAFIRLGHASSEKTPELFRNWVFDFADVDSNLDVM